MSLAKDIQALLEAGVITRETADNIHAYYNQNKGLSSNRLLTIFGILGALLVGLGIILIIAHNWDELSRTTKTLFAFLPMLMGQIVCGFVLLRKAENVTWREGASTFLIFSIGACISLISQIYHIPGNLSSFMLTWSLLTLPLIYVMRSSMASLLYLIGITYYACETSYFSYPTTESYLYWLLLLLSLPYYYLLSKAKPKSNFLLFHNWIVPLSVIITLGTLTENNGELMFVAYFSLFGLYYLIEELSWFKGRSLLFNGYRILGSIGTILLLLILSFNWFWEELIAWETGFDEILTTPEFLVSAFISLIAGGLFYVYAKSTPLKEIKPLSFLFILFISAFILGTFSSIAVVLINIFVFGLGILIILDGARQNHLGILNIGLLIITALVMCRFFDTDLSFVLRGILFVSVGVGFFVANYWMLKKRREHET